MNDTLALILIGISFGAGLYVYGKVDKAVEQLNPLDNIKKFFGVK